MMVWLLLAACAPKTVPPTAVSPAPAAPIVTLSDDERALNVTDDAPVSVQLTTGSSGPSALAPILIRRSVGSCDPESVLCRAVTCEVANRMASGFPSRWTFSLVGPNRVEVRENLRWILPPDTAEARSVPLPVATFLTARCSASGGAQSTARATACADRTDCVDVVCSAWSTAGSASYIDAHLELPDGRTFDHDAQPVTIPSGDEVIQTVFRFVPESDAWHPGQATEPTELRLAGKCAYWQGDSPVEPLP